MDSTALTGTAVPFRTGTGREGEVVRLVVRLHSSGLDPVTLERLYQAVRHAESPSAVLRWAELLGTAGPLRLVTAGPILELEELPLLRPDRPFDDTARQAHPVGRPEHARLARDLREMTGLGARVLGGVLGVTREQYSRWTSGQPISDLRHGQLRYLHTLMAELIRRRGAVQARAWLHQPIGGGSTPVELLETRQWEKLHREIVGLPDPSPVIDTTYVALPIQDDDGLSDEDAEDEPWSPYPSPDETAERGGRR